MVVETQPGVQPSKSWFSTVTESLEFSYPQKCKERVDGDLFPPGQKTWWRQIGADPQKHIAFLWTRLPMPEICCGGDHHVSQ